MKTCGGRIKGRSRRMRRTRGVLSMECTWSGRCDRPTSGQTPSGARKSRHVLNIRKARPCAPLPTLVEGSSLTMARCESRRGDDEARPRLLPPRGGDGCKAARGGRSCRTRHKGNVEHFRKDPTRPFGPPSPQRGGERPLTKFLLCSHFQNRNSFMNGAIRAPVKPGWRTAEWNRLHAQMLRLSGTEVPRWPMR